MQTTLTYPRRGIVSAAGPGMDPVNHSTLNGTGDNDSREDWSLAEFLWVYVAPFIFIAGITGNVLVFIVMGRQKFQGTTTSVYLRMMAVADVLVLLAGMITEWLEASHLVVFKELHPATCKLEKFLNYTLGDTAIWILVAFTMDRFIAVVFPLEKTGICKPRRAYQYCLALFLAAIAKNTHVFWTRGAQYELDGEEGRTILVSNCGRPTPAYRHFSVYIRPWIAFALVSVLPFCVILVCNVMIIKTLVQAKRLHRGQKIQSNNSKTYMQMTAMCLSASFAFLVCITPSIVLLIGKPHWTSAKKPNVAYDIAKAINNQLVYVNHSINFFLYCITGQRFRQELMLACRRQSGSGSSASHDDLSTESKTTFYKTAIRNHQRANGFRPSVDIRYCKVESKI